jgi:H+-transporting ATPase
LHPLRRALAKYWAPVPWMIEAGIIAAFLAFNAALVFFQEGALRPRLRR